MELAVWIVTILVFVLLVVAFFMFDYVTDIANRLQNMTLWFEKIEKKLDNVEQLLKQQMEEARNRHIR